MKTLSRWGFFTEFVRAMTMIHIALLSN